MDSRFYNKQMTEGEKYQSTLSNWTPWAVECHREQILVLWHSLPWSMMQCIYQSCSNGSMSTIWVSEMWDREPPLQYKTPLLNSANGPMRTIFTWIQLSANSCKCTLPEPPALNLGTNTLDVAEETKILGVWIQDNIKRDEQEESAFAE